MSALSVSNEREIQPYQLPLEQLAQLKTQHEEELQELQRQMESLFGAKTRFMNAKTSLMDLAENKEDTQLMIPLNASLYVPGRIKDADKVIVELGTGYFSEKTVKEAADLIDRKSQLVVKSIESVENVATKKKRNLEQLMQIMQYKMQQQQK